MNKCASKSCIFANLRCVLALKRTPLFAVQLNGHIKISLISE